MSESQEDTPQEGAEPDVETEIAEQMTPDADETPDDVTGPGPESPFQPPDLTPDDEPEPDDEPATDAPEPDEPEADEAEALADYAPGVAEARLMSEREAEQLGKKLDQERKRHGKKVMELLGNDLGGHIPCPTCMDGIDGFIVSPEFAPLDPEQRDRMMQILGLDDWEHMPEAEWAVQCSTCLGFGKVKTGSHVHGRETTGCEDCHEAGFINTRKPAPVVPIAAETNGGVTGPTVVQDYDPDPRVDALRRDGFMVMKLPTPAEG